jgi:hypothetical protein
VSITYLLLCHSVLLRLVTLLQKLAATATTVTVCSICHMLFVASAVAVDAAAARIELIEQLTNALAEQPVCNMI